MTLYNTPHAMSTQCALALIDYAQEQLPNEACGILLCNSNSDCINEFRPITNTHPQPRSAFLFSPEEWIRQYFAAQQNQNHIVGFFHSHPTEEAIPSMYDNSINLEKHMLYCIISLKQKNSPQLKFFRFDESNDQLKDYPLMMT